MNIVTRRFVRVLVLALVGVGLSACCFHPNYCGDWGGCYRPVRHCR